jgi:hypothetical protein
VTLEPIRDNTLYEVTPDTTALSNGAGDHLFSGRTADGVLRRALLVFDVASALPEGAIIEDVSLTLHVSRAQVADRLATLHRVLADWGEAGSDAPGQEGRGAAAEPGDATWFHAFFPGVVWANPGGDFAAAASGGTTIGGIGSYTFSSPEMANDVVLWLSDPSQNFGWIVLGDETVDSTAKRFDSRENPDLPVRPQLVIEYSGVVANESTTWSGVKKLFQ